jgi:hypothetical protein
MVGRQESNHCLSQQVNAPVLLTGDPLMLFKSENIEVCTGQLDLVIVDPTTNKPFRPWQITVIDKMTRAILAIHITPEKPTKSDIENILTQTAGQERDVNVYSSP